MKNSLKKLLLGGAAVLALGIASQDVMAQATDTATVPATAVVVRAIDINTVDALDFGTFVSPGSADTITIGSDTTADNSSTNNYNGISVVTQGNPGQVDVFAEGTQAFSLTVGTITDLTNGTPADDMAISNVTIAGATPGNAVNSAQNTANDTDANRYEIGADIAVAAGQTGGTYNGSVDIVATYD